MKKGQRGVDRKKERERERQRESEREGGGKGKGRDNYTVCQSNSRPFVS